MKKNKQKMVGSIVEALPAEKQGEFETERILGPCYPYVA